MSQSVDGVTEAAFYLGLLPPSVNTYWRQARHSGVRYISKQGQAFRLEMLVAVREVFRGVVPKFAGPVEVRIILEDSSKRRWDLDNKAGKAILDGLVYCGLLSDDSQVARLVAEKFPAGVSDATRTWIQIRRVVAMSMEKLYDSWQRRAEQSGSASLCWAYVREERDEPGRD